MKKGGGDLDESDCCASWVQLVAGGGWRCRSVGLMLVAGCGSQSAPGRNSVSPTVSTTTSTTSAKSPKPAASNTDATIEMATALDTAAHAGYVATFAAISITTSQRGLELQMTDLAQGSTLIAKVRSGHPEWAAVPVALVKVPYTEQRLEAAQKALPDAAWTKYQLVGVGYGTGRYLEVTSSDTRLKAPVAGRAAREKLAQTLTSQLGVRVLVTYSTPAHAG